MALTKKAQKEWCAMTRYMERIFFGVIGRNTRICTISADPDDVAYTTEDGRIFINPENSIGKNLDFTHQKVVWLGLFTHEMLHQKYTDFAYLREILSMMPRSQRGIFSSLHNLVEDPAIEFMGREAVSETFIDALNYTIAITYDQTPPLESCMNELDQYCSALIQFGDIGLLKGEFTFPKAEQCFTETAEMVYDAIHTVEGKGRVDACIPIMHKILEIFEIDTDEIEKAMQEAEKKFKKGESKGRGHGEKGKIGEDGRKEKRKKLTLHKKKKSDDEDNLTTEGDPSSMPIPDGDLEAWVDPDDDNPEHSTPIDLNDYDVEIDDDLLDELLEKETGEIGQADGSDSEEGKGRKPDNSQTDPGNSDAEKDAPAESEADGKAGSGSKEAADGQSAGQVSDAEDSGSSSSDADSESGSNGSPSDANSTDGNDSGSSRAESSKSGGNAFDRVGKDREYQSDAESQEREAESGDSGDGGRVVKGADLLDEGDLPNFTIEEFEPTDDSIAEINQNVKNEMANEQKRQLQEQKEQKLPEILDMNGTRYESLSHEEVSIAISDKDKMAYADAYNRITQKFAAQVRSLSTRLEKIFENDLDETAYRQSGKVSMKRLMSPRMTTKVFNRKVYPGDKKNFCIMMLVDESGSMYGQKIGIARDTAICLAEAFAPLGIPLYVMGFTADENGFGANHRHYIQWDNTRMARLSLVAMKARCDNADGFSIRYGSELLKKRSEMHKLIFVISDGQPNARCYRGTLGGVKDTIGSVKEARKDADVIGILIGDHSETELSLYQRMYGQEFLYVQKTEDLFATILKILKQRMNRW